MSQNIIFLDIDGVLNSNNTFKENYGFRKAISKLPKNSPLEHQLYLSQINDLAVELDEKHLAKVNKEMKELKMLFPSYFI